MSRNILCFLKTFGSQNTPRIFFFFCNLFARNVNNVCSYTLRIKESREFLNDRFFLDCCAPSRTTLAASYASADRRYHCLLYTSVVRFIIIVESSFLLLSFGLVIYSTPVSYTHLDVYKRQLYYCGVCFIVEVICS